MKKKLFQKIYERPKKKCLAGPGRTVACDPAAAAGRVMSSWLNNSMQRRGDVRSGLIREKIERARLQIPMGGVRACKHHHY